MKNTIFLDSDFNFLLLENEEEDTGLTQTKIFINIPTSDATNQALDISVAGGAPVTKSIPSETVVNFELSQEYWADNGDVEITPKNDDITGDTITIHFSGIFTTSAALNYIADDEFEVLAQSEEFAEEGSAGGGSGSGSGGGSAFDFVETIRNIGLRLLDEPTNVNVNFDLSNIQVKLTWRDPADINTLEPVPCEWAGTIVVRKEGSAPLHRWDGILLVDSTTRNEYSNTPLIDNAVEENKVYFYGIFPYHIALNDTNAPIKYYRFTKNIRIYTQSFPPNNWRKVDTLLDENTVDAIFDNIITLYDHEPLPGEVVINWNIDSNNILNCNANLHKRCILTKQIAKYKATKLYIEVESTHDETWGNHYYLACAFTSSFPYNYVNLRIDTNKIIYTPFIEYLENYNINGETPFYNLSKNIIEISLSSLPDDQPVYLTFASCDELPRISKIYFDDEIAVEP